KLAKFYKQEWDRLEAAGDGYPSSLASSNVRPGTASAGAARLTAWFAPTLRLVDLAFARRLIQGAGQGVLFLFFNPGPKGTLLNDILALDADRLYIHGVANQDPGGKNKPVIRLVHRGKVVKAPPEVALPAAIDKRLRYWLPEMAGYSMVRVHSKVVDAHHAIAGHLREPVSQPLVDRRGERDLGRRLHDFAAVHESDDRLVFPAGVLIGNPVDVEPVGVERENVVEQRSLRPRIEEEEEHALARPLNQPAGESQVDEPER